MKLRSTLPSTGQIQAPVALLAVDGAGAGAGLAGAGAGRVVLRAVFEPLLDGDDVERLAEALDVEELPEDELPEDVGALRVLLDGERTALVDTCRLVLRDAWRPLGARRRTI